MNGNGYGRLVDSADYYKGSSVDQSHKTKKVKGSGETSALMSPPSSSRSRNAYVYSDGTIADHEDETIELGNMTQRNQKGGSNRSYKSTGATDDILTTRIPLLKTDTLHSISIKFRCTVPEIKRINGLYTDQEFYACTSIKIPVRSHQMHLQEELDERVTAGGDLRTTKVKSPADIVSSETSEDEESRLHSAAEAPSIADMVEIHSDPDDEEALALLDRQHHHKPHGKGGTRDQRMYEKMIGRKDEEIKALADKVQQQRESSDVVASLRADSDNLLHTNRRKSCLTSCAVSVPCLMICFVIIIIVIPGYFLYQYYSKEDEHNTAP